MKWILPEQSEKDIFEWLIKSRGIEDRTKFLNPSWEHIYSPTLLHDMDRAVKAIIEAIGDKKKIFIHGDFDVDGITATSILWDFLFRKAGADVMPYIPSRFEEGYGLSDASIQSIIDQGGELIITVDCGVKDIELVEKYKDKVDFVITDHHTIVDTSRKPSFRDKKSYKQVGDHLISAYAKAVVHPKLGGTYPFTEISGATVSWKLACALNDALKLGLDMKDYLDLVALGAVCDIMPLVDENRSIVKLGLEQLRRTKNIGLIALLELARVDKRQVDTYHIGFVIGPRLNAAGRLGKAIDAVKLLSTSSPQNAKRLAVQLNELNIQRQDLTKNYFEKADELVQDQLMNKLLFVYGDNWPEGIVGLIAGKLAQKYNRPVLVGSKDENGNIKGSARSIESFNIAEVLKQAEKYLIRHGGHAGAAGFTLDTSALSDFVNVLTALSEEKITPEDLEDKLLIDAICDADALDIEYVQRLDNFAPFGHKNEKPLLALLSQELQDVRFVGSDKTHALLTVKDKSGKYLEAIGFGMADIVKAHPHETPIDLAGYLEVDEWNGNRKVKMKLKAIR